MGVEMVVRRIEVWTGANGTSCALLLSFAFRRLRYVRSTKMLAHIGYVYQYMCVVTKMCAV